ncbi:hypothetical protein ACSBR1_004417 [Camellia fascicularis]
MAFSHHPFSLFPNLNDSLIEIADTSSSKPRWSAPAPIFNFPVMLDEQLMVVQFDVDSNHYTLKSCVERVTMVSNLSHWLQNRTNEVHWLNAQLSLLQRIYKDAQLSLLQRLAI